LISYVNLLILFISACRIFIVPEKDNHWITRLWTLKLPAPHAGFGDIRKLPGIEANLLPEMCGFKSLATFYRNSLGVPI